MKPEGEEFSERKKEKTLQEKKTPASFVLLRHYHPTTLTEYRNRSFEALSLVKTVRMAGDTDERRRRPRWPGEKMEFLAAGWVIFLPFLFFGGGKRGKEKGGRFLLRLVYVLFLDLL